MRSLLFRVFLLAISLLTLAACSTTQKNQNAKLDLREVNANLEAGSAKSPLLNAGSVQKSKAVTKAAFKWQARPRAEVAPGYEVEIVNANDSQLNGRFRSRFDGVLELPYEVSVDSSGLTERQLKQKILQAYSAFYQTTPTLQISVVDKKYWVDVRGLVNRPGQYLVRNDSSIDEIIGAAGGLYNAESREGTSVVTARFLRIKQGSQSGLISLAEYYAGLITLVPVWQGGEQLFFQSERGETPLSIAAADGSIQIIGQVRQPGEYAWHEDWDFFRYLVKAGGPTDRADLSRVEVIRADGQDRELLVYDLFDAEERVKMTQLQAGDVLLLHADNETKTEKKTRLWSEVASIITGFATVVILAVTL